MNKVTSQQKINFPLCKQVNRITPIGHEGVVVWFRNFAWGVFSKVVIGFLNFGYDWGRCLKLTLQIHALENFHTCRWGTEQRVLCTQNRKRRPISAWAKISGASVQVTFKHLPQPHKSHIRSFETLQQLLKIINAIFLFLTSLGLWSNSCPKSSFIRHFLPGIF